MADDVKESSVFTVNEGGAIAVWLTNSNTGKSGELPTNQVPTNDDGEVVMAVGGDLNVKMDTMLAGETPDKDWIKVESGAGMNKTVLSGKVDFPLGSIGAAGDYLKRINAVVTNSATSRVVMKEGLPLPKKQINTHGATASTTTTLNTAINPDAVVADQYKDHLVRVGTSGYRKILSHAAFAAGVVNAYTLDVALSAAPAVNTPIYIENPDLVIEVLPNGVTVDTHPILVERYCAGPGWRISTEATVSAFCSGDFDNV